MFHRKNRIQAPPRITEHDRVRAVYTRGRMMLLLIVPVYMCLQNPHKGG